MNTGRGPDPWQGSALHPPGGGNHSPLPPTKKSTEMPDRIAVRPFCTLQRRNGFTPHQIVFANRLSIQRSFSLSMQRNS